jgi:hypothetical protein
MMAGQKKKCSRRCIVQEEKYKLVDANVTISSSCAKCGTKSIVLFVFESTKTMCVIVIMC